VRTCPLEKWRVTFSLQKAKHHHMGRVKGHRNGRTIMHLSSFIFTNNIKHLYIVKLKLIMGFITLLQAPYRKQCFERLFSKHMNIKHLFQIVGIAEIDKKKTLPNDNNLYYNNVSSAAAFLLLYLSTDGLTNRIILVLQKSSSVTHSKFNFLVPGWAWRTVTNKSIEES